MKRPYLVPPAGDPDSVSGAISPIEEIIEDARNGRPYILVDAEDRENEGDVIIPAQFATPDQINFMAKHARGLVCLSITAERARQLRLPPMASDNQSGHGTAFTVSIEAREGVTTGISAHDRAHTLAVAVDPTHQRIEDDYSSKRQRHDQNARYRRAAHEQPVTPDRATPMSRFAPGVAEVSSGEAELHEAHHHSYTCRSKPVVPVDLLAQPAANQGADERAEVDAHVEDREPRITPRAALGIKLANERADVRLEQAGADHDEDEAEEKCFPPRSRDREMPDGDQDATGPDRPLRTEQAIRDPSARQRGEIHTRRVESVDRGRNLVVESKPALGRRRDHEEHEQRAHAVIAQALPHLREEERVESAWMFCRSGHGLDCFLG